MPVSVCHGQVERLLYAMRPGGQRLLWGQAVRRLDARSWSVGGGAALGLLATIDAVLGKPDAEDPCSFPAGYGGEWWR